MKNIYFADLTHTAQGVQARCMPLGAGSVAATIKKEFKELFHVSLFKLPGDLENAILEKCPDILCLSNYAWNLKLTIAFAERVKEINPQLIIILGGPNFPYKQEERQRFLEEYSCIDFYIFGEGELALAHLLQQLLDHDFQVANLKENEAELINCAYLTNDKKRIVSGKWTRTDKLDQLPCPYTEGLMDKFFDTRLIPLYETTRGCPFSCTFCTDGINEKSKVFRKSHENIERSLQYISENIKHCDDLYVADLNFGMYDEDIRTATFIANMRKTTGFPVIFGTALGKSKPERIMKAVEILDGSLHIGLSLQSTDAEVLTNIRRKNIPTPKLLAAAENIGLRDAIDFTEVILALPGDSLIKHYNTLREGVDLGMTNIRMYQLMLLTGSMMNSEESRKNFGLQTRWRVMPNCAGVYHFFGKELRVAEIEEIVVENNTMTFEDYVDCRVMDFVVEVFVNNDWYVELFELIKLYDLKVFDFLVFVKQNTHLYPPKIAAIFNSFVADTRKDLFVEKKAIEEYILGVNILEKHVNGELGNNEILDHKALCYLNFAETTQFIFAMARSFLSSNNIDVDAVTALYLEDLSKFILCRKNDVQQVEKNVDEQFNFDFQLIAQSGFKVDPHKLIVSRNQLNFFHDDVQASIIRKASLLYGASISGLGRFIQNNKMNRMFRQFQANPLKIEDGAPESHLADADPTTELSLAETIASPDPQEINALISLLNEARYVDAAAFAQTMTERFPLHGFGWKVLGAVFKLMNRNSEALAAMQQAAALLPDDAEAYNNLGVTLKGLGRLAEAETSYRRALAIDPNDADAHYNLGGALQGLGRLDEAEASYRRALTINPNSVEAHNNLGVVLHNLGRPDEAESCFQQALALKSDYLEAYCNLGKTLKELGRLDEAEASYRRALEIKADYAEVYNNLGNTLQHLRRLDEAEASFRRALQIKPDYAHAYNNLGCLLQKLGQLDNAVTCFCRTLEIDPNYVMAHSNLIFTLDLMDNKDAASLHQERKRWDAAHAAHLHQQLIYPNSPDPERRIRIGYVSADLRRHSAANAFGGMLTRYDQSKFEVFAYSNLKRKGDDLTDLFKQSVTAWRNIIGLSDEAVAKLVRDDRIDILVDLSGHTADNRLLVFARKPAPIQASGWTHSMGTGMRAIDVFFTDPVTVPPEDQQYFTENIRYLPCIVGSFFIDPFPEVNELPALSNGMVTFGSFNRLAKASDNTYRTWAQVLLAVPQSRLILKTAELDNAATRERIVEHFIKAGVVANRIIMQGKTSWYEHMQAYHQIDIGLDPFPQGGGVTALEGLMMGAPIINLQGQTVIGRSSASIMTTLGLTDWIAKSKEDYVDLAMRKTADLQSLALLRRQLRKTFSSSVIGDQTAYVRAVEHEYRQLWRQWCSHV